MKKIISISAISRHRIDGEKCCNCYGKKYTWSELYCHISMNRILKLIEKDGFYTQIKIKYK